MMPQSGRPEINPFQKGVPDISQRHLGRKGASGYPVYVSLFDANTILAANTDNTPAALTVPEQTLVGRITSGNIDALTVAEVWNLLADHAGMYRHEYGVATAIQAANKWHLNNGCTQGTKTSNWTFDAGQQLAITAYADNGDSKTQVTSNGHGMSNGWVVSIAGTANYDGVWVIEQVAANTFVINTAFVLDDGASTGEQGAFLKTSQAGVYKVDYTASITPANAGDTVEFSLYQNATQVTKSEAQHKLVGVGDYGVVAGQAILTLAANDLVLWAVQNLTGASNFTIRDGNVTITRIG